MLRAWKGSLDRGEAVAWTGKLALQRRGELTVAQRSGGTAEPVGAAARVYGGCGGEDGVQGGRRGHLKGPGHLGRACPGWNLAEICGRGSRPGVAGGGGQTWRAGPGWQRAGGAGVWGRAAAGRGDAALRAGWLAPPGGASVAVGACGPSTPRGRSGAEAREGRNGPGAEGKSRGPS